MDPDKEESDVFSDTEETQTEAREDEEDREEGEEDEEEEDEEEDARIFNTWMHQYRRKEMATGQEDGGGEGEEGRAESRGTVEPPVCVRVDRRNSLPCPSTLSAMHLSRLHLSSRAPVTARVLLRRTSSRRLLPSPQEAGAPPNPDQRRGSLVPAIPEAATGERRSTFRRRNVMSLSDADSVCLICHIDLNQGAGGKTELQCSHAFHKECIEEWLWRKQCCPTCKVQVSMPQPVYWNSTRVKVP